MEIKEQLNKSISSNMLRDFIDNKEAAKSHI